MSAPTIPPRPARKQNPLAPVDVPQIPPRPNRTVERSVSPANRDSYARSPFHDASFAHNKTKGSANGHTTDMSVPQRPPSVTLPSIGQEGNEYASLEDVSQTDGDSPKHTTSGVGDLPLHAPKASVPSSTAKSRIATVTRTDSSQAAAAGIGKPFTETAPRSPGFLARPASSARSSSRPSSRPSSRVNSRPQSVHEAEDEPGIPEIGVQVPMYPNAGDVQAPTPAPSAVEASGLPPARKRQDAFHGPPGSYGMHGHGRISADPIEKAWYEKHPDALAEEEKGEYGPAIPDERKEWALSSDDLNRLVRSTAPEEEKSISGPTDHPEEEIGYLASEEYAARMASTQPPFSPLGRQRTGSSQHAESPLRKTSFPGEDIGSERPRPGSIHAGSAVESENEDDVVHIDPSQNSRRGSRMLNESFEDLRHTSVPEEDYHPILASDEVAKRPGSGFMVPAISPELERFHSHEDQPQISSRSHSRNNSRQSLHAPSPKFPDLERSTSTPLGHVKEYEPLFPEDEKEGAKPDQWKNRPDLARHHFPSKDIWEDTPSSLQLHATIDEPEAVGDYEARPKVSASQVFESPEAEAQRRAGANAVKAPSVPQRPGAKQAVKSHLKPDVVDDMAGSRPGMKQRFPSHDIWEDTPDHHQLVTTVETPPPQTEQTSPVETSKPHIPDRPGRAKPTVPARPNQPEPVEALSGSTERQVPSIPDRPKPKPSVPARPSKPKGSASSEKVPQVGEDVAASAAAKPKPAAPPKPAGGSKFAALKAGFMSDLNSRLQVGPPGVKHEEEKVEETPKKPLADARKGRARGPQRRKPTPSPSAAGVEPTEKDICRIAPAVTVWSISDEGSLVLGKEPQAPGTSVEVDAPAQVTPLPTERPGDASSSGADAVGLESVPEPTKEVDNPLESASVPTNTAAPEVTSESTAAGTSQDTSEHAVQTGQQDIVVSSPGATEKITAYVDGGKESGETILVNEADEAGEKVKDSE